MSAGQSTRPTYVCEHCGKSFQDKPSHPRRFCSKDCRYKGLTAPVEVRLQRRLGPVTDKGCIPWTGGTHEFGYGSISVPGKGRGGWRNVCAHRVAYELAFGPVPDGLSVLHHCDNPACCNPAHLFLGTQPDNIADKMAKGRHIKGETVPWHRLTAEQVVAARKRYEAGEATCAQLAREHGVTRGTMSGALRRKSWKHV